MRISVFDVETTGLRKHKDVPDHEQPRVIEFAGIITDGSSVIDKIEFLVNPLESLDPIITKITGLTDADLLQASVFSQCVGQISDYFKSARAGISHNLSFDRGMLSSDLQRSGHDLSSVHFPTIQICSVEQTMPMFGRRMKLSELYEFGIGPADQKHRAMDDVLMLHEVCKHFGIYDSILRAHA